MMYFCITVVCTCMLVLTALGNTAEEAPKYRDIVFECGMRDYMWREKVKAALTPEDKEKRKCKLPNL